MFFSITSEDINLLPLGAYENKMILISQPEELSWAFEEIANHVRVGFDTETKPVFVKGQRNKVALMQIALPSKVYLIRLKTTGVTPEMIDFLQNENIEKKSILEEEKKE